MDELIINDFSASRTISGAPVQITGGWELKQYISSAGKGMLLCALPGEDGEDLVLKLDKIGWYRIFIGMYNHDFRSTFIKIKLSGDSLFRKICTGSYSKEIPGFVEEGFWKASNLTDQDLIIRRVGKRRGNLAYVKLVSMTDIEILEYKSVLVGKRANLGAVFDVGDLFFNDEGPFTPESIHETLEPFVNSDFGIICWGTTNSTYTCLYHTKIGDVFGEGVTDFYGEGMKKTAAFIAASKKDGWDPLKVAVKYCHMKGLQIFADYRIEHTYDINAYNGNFTGRFQREHQHCRMMNRDGKFSPFLSLAYDEVQDYKVAVLSEMAEYGVDGIYIDFGRCSPVVSYCSPIVEGYIKEYRVDPRTLDPHDIQWLNFRADFVTRFMRKLKAAIAGIEVKLGKKINIAAQVEYGYTHTADPHCNLIDKNLVLGYALDKWAKEGLVDIIAPSEKSSMYFMYNLDYYRHVVKGTDCQLWATLGQMDNSMFPMDYDWEEYFMVDTLSPMKQIMRLNAERLERNAADCYAQGAEGVFLWEAGDTYCSLDRWNILARLGHKDEIVQKWSASVARFDHPPRIGYRDIQFIDNFEQEE